MNYSKNLPLITRYKKTWLL